METADGSEVSVLGEQFLSTGAGSYVVEGAQDGDDGEENQVAPGDNEPLREQDRFLPIANVARIMKKSLPKSGKIAKDAKECVQECVSEFISFITSEASERCQQEKRKTINGEDILFAMSTLGFDNYVEPLKTYLQKYRETLHQTSKGDKSLTLDGDGAPIDLGAADDVFGTSVGANILTDQSGQNVIYTTAYPTQITTQGINFG